jgi:ribosomal protein L34
MFASQAPGHIARKRMSGFRVGMRTSSAVPWRQAR